MGLRLNNVMQGFKSSSNLFQRTLAYSKEHWMKGCRSQVSNLTSENCKLNPHLLNSCFRGRFTHG